jgi:hypothetical protein
MRRLPGPLGRGGGIDEEANGPGGEVCRANLIIDRSASPRFKPFVYGF